MRKSLAVCTALALVTPLTAFAYGKLTYGSTMTMTKISTTGVYINRQIWLPGTWTVNQCMDSVAFTKPAPDKVHQSFVKLSTIPMDNCSFGIIRIAALKAWGGTSLNQSQARIEAMSFGTSKYKGYTWTMPSTWDGTEYWCIGQDLKNAVEVSAPVGDTDTINFIKSDLLTQLVVRNGRAVLPWPAGYTSSSSSSSKSEASPTCPISQ